jgi:NAD(P)-dependent dehydrogenase (short-subunit alcohol dehydrogenase family)
MGFADSVALVTGAGSGIGRGVALELARRGAIVVCADIDAATAEATANDARVAGGRASGAQLDVADRQAYADLVERIVGSSGRLDYLFNNAGIAVGGDVRDLAHEQWKRIVDVNLWGVIHGVEAAYPAMCARRAGHIVNTASVAGLVPFVPMTPYATTKHAVVGLTLSLRAEAHAFGVKVSAICPAFIETGIFAAAHVAKADREKATRGLLLFKPLATDDAVRRILRGVERNRALIVFPFYAHLLWWTQRLCSTGLQPMMRWVMRRFRALREAS